MQDGRALQDVLKVRCFGCGSLNEHGLQIKSHWQGDELVCFWRPPSHHIGHPGVVYGGTIASIVDCHSIWTALATWCRDTGTDIATAAPPVVTGKLTVTFLKPARIDQVLELRARVLDAGERRATVGCRVLQDGDECAVAEVITVRIDTKE
ncbi:MAG: PaaI family thioesterase [Rhizobacter sp.]